MNVKRLCASHRPHSNPPPPEKGRYCEPFFYAVLGFLLALTLFLPGEQPERTACAHLQCILWLLAALFWMFAVPSQGGRLKGGTPVFADKFIYGFFAWVIISILINGNRGGGVRPGQNMLSVWFLFASAYFLFRESLQSAKIVRTVFVLITAVMFAQVLTGLYQQFIDIPAMQRQLEAAPETVVASIDPSVRPGSPDWEHLVSRLKTAGPTGTYPLTNSLGGLLACWLFVLFFGVKPILFDSLNRLDKLRPSLKAVLFLSIAALFILCFLLTKCRSGIAAVFAGLVLFAVLDLRKRWNTGYSNAKKIRFAAGLFLMLVLFAVLMLLPGKSILDGAKRSLGFRLEYWTASLGMIQNHYLIGCGSGNFKQSYTKYKLPYSSEEIADPHNFAVEIAAESGLPALILFLIPLGILFWKMMNGRQLYRLQAGNSSTEQFSSSLSNLRPELYWGGLLGCWAAFFFSFSSEASMNPIAPAAATFVFPLCAFLYKKPEGEQLSITPIFFAFVVLLVHLCAAGGISVTSTAILVWLFAAVLVNHFIFNDSAEKTCSPYRKYRIAVFLVFAVLWVNYFGLRPVSQARFLTAEIEDPLTSDVRRAELLRQAVKADPNSAVLREQYADTVFQRWFREPNNKALENEAFAEMMNTQFLLQRSAAVRFRFAQKYVLMFEKTGDENLRRQALQLYREAIQRYPNNARYRAVLSSFLVKTAKNEEERREGFFQRDEAIRLDDLMPHLEQKLPLELRKTL